MVEEKLGLLQKVGGQAVLGRQNILPTPWLTERHGYDPTSGVSAAVVHGVGVVVHEHGGAHSG